MSGINVDEWSYTGMQVGLGLAVIPAATTTLIACSKIIIINIIVDTALKILTANHYGGTAHGVSFVSVPLLWKISKITAIVGVTIAAVSFTGGFVHRVYRRQTIE